MYCPCPSNFDLYDIDPSQKLFTNFGIGVLHGVSFHGVCVCVCVVLIRIRIAKRRSHPDQLRML